MKAILNCLMYVTQWLHLRMGGKIEVARDRVVLIAPKGRHFFATENKIEARLKVMESQATDTQQPQAKTTQCDHEGQDGIKNGMRVCLGCGEEL